MFSFCSTTIPIHSSLPQKSSKPAPIKVDFSYTSEHIVYRLFLYTTSHIRHCCFDTKEIEERGEEKLTKKKTQCKPHQPHISQHQQPNKPSTHSPNHESQELNTTRGSRADADQLRPTSGGRSRWCVSEASTSSRLNLRSRSRRVSSWSRWVCGFVDVVRDWGLMRFALGFFLCEFFLPSLLFCLFRIKTAMSNVRGGV